MHKPIDFSIYFSYRLKTQDIFGKFAKKALFAIFRKCPLANVQDCRREVADRRNCFPMFEKFQLYVGM